MTIDVIDRIDELGELYRGKHSDRQLAKVRTCSNVERFPRRPKGSVRKSFPSYLRKVTVLRIRLEDFSSPHSSFFPSERTSMIVSPGVSLLVAGVASGVCFLLLGSLRSRKHSKTKEARHVVTDDGRCACCLAPFLVGRGVRCSDCGARTCRKACSRWDTTDNAWRCLFCHQRRSRVRRNEKWFENFGRAANNEEELHRFFGTAKSRVYVAGHAAANTEQIQENGEEIRTVHAVRNFVEKIIEGLVDNVDDTTIDRLYDNPEYDAFLEKHRPPLTAVLIRLVTCLRVSLINKPSTDSPAMAHAALREIVERAVEEARKLPALNTSEDGEQPREGRTIADHSYEDLLATAILNKVIERLQQERVDGNSNVLHITDLSKTKYTSNESEHGIEEDVENYEYNGDRGAPIRQNGDHREPTSFMMEERIEEVTTITSDDEAADNDALEYGCTRRVPFPEFGMDIVDPPRELPLSSPSSNSSDSDHNENSRIKTKYRTEHTMDLVSPIESWEDNWLFQKKRNARSQPDAVAMLVPSSNTCYKALIGDKDAEDTSDLSECSSTRSDEEFEKELMEAINNVTPRSSGTSECDAENSQQVPNDMIQLDEDEVDQICQAETTKAVEIAAEKVVEDEDDKKRRSESLPTLITGTKEEESKTKEKPPKDTAKHGEKTIATVLESSTQKDVKVQLEKSSERSDRGNVADDDEEQRESEYTEHYDTAIQRHLDSLTKVDVCGGESELADETGKLTEGQPEKSEDNLAEEEKSERSEAKVQLTYATSKSHVDITAEKDQLSGPPRPGTIAEREHKKWENAPPIENNPYSEENIRKRSWERRYSRKSADVSGVHYELTELNEVNLDTLLTSDPPDIKRFSRDYYINQSKIASGERLERARSAMSSSSRPSSSLSQRSSCAGDEQRERQVSHKLEQFEAASLHSSLSRRRCRDPHASSHFAINPLLHLEITQSPVNDSSAPAQSDESNLSATNSAATENPEEKEDLRIEIEEPIMPRYNDNNREGSPGDQDSGMCSIGSRDSEVGSERDRWRQLCRQENDDQISSVGGRRFWTTAYKYHTFGGIRMWPKRPAEDLVDLDDLDDESASLDDRLAQSEHAPEFARFKYQTFGGIKRSRRIDGRRIRLRPRIPLKAAGKSHGLSNQTQSGRSADEERPECPEHLVCSSSFEGFASFEHSTSSALEESDWQDEVDDVANDRIPARIERVDNRNATRVRHRNSIRRENASSSSLPSVAGEIIMDKFLRDVSKRRRACAFSDNVATSRGKKTKFRRRREISEEGIDGKLEKSTSGSKKKSSENLKGSRRAQEHKNDNKRRCDKIYVRSLSDITIW